MTDESGQSVPTVASASQAGHVAFNTALAGVPSAAVIAYFVSQYVHPHGQALPDWVAAAIGGGVAAGAGFLWHVSELLIAKYLPVNPPPPPAK